MPEVHVLAAPVVDLGAGGHLCGVAGRLVSAGIDGIAIRHHEPKRTVVQPLDADAAFVHRAVVEAT